MTRIGFIESRAAKHPCPLDRRLDGLDERVGRVEARLDGLEGRLEGLEQKMDRARYATPMRYVALLRAINVGGRTVKMDRLRAMFEQVPLKKVETFIASGNVLFDSTASAGALEVRIEEHLEQSLGFPVKTMVRSAGEIAAVAAYTPFPSVKTVPRPGGLYVGFLKSVPDKTGIAKVMALTDAINDFHFNGRELYWRARDRMAVLKMSPAKFERAVGTTRGVVNMHVPEKWGYVRFAR